MKNNKLIADFGMRIADWKGKAFLIVILEIFSFK